MTKKELITFERVKSYWIVLTTKEIDEIKKQSYDIRSSDREKLSKEEAIDKHKLLTKAGFETRIFKIKEKSEITYNEIE